jgi:hypothetical protein
MGDPTKATNAASPQTVIRPQPSVAAGMIAVVLVFAGCARSSGAAGGPSTIWYDRQGHRVPDGTDKESRFALELGLSQGDEHCDWDSVTFLEIAWPLGSIVHSGEGIRQRVRQYVRGPTDVLGDLPLRSSFDPNATLPPNATNTGYQSGDDWQLWTSPDDVDRQVYLVNGQQTERWPRTEYFLLCR